jgi:hypothetical protein
MRRKIAIAQVLAGPPRSSATMALTSSVRPARRSSWTDAIAADTQEEL